MLIHILHHGVTLCGIMTIPKDWPEDQKWAGWRDRAHATCPGCIEEGDRHRDHLNHLYNMVDSDAENYDRVRDEELLLQQDRVDE